MLINCCFIAVFYLVNKQNNQPISNIKRNSDGLATSESNRDNSNKVVYTLLGKLQQSNEAIEQIVTNPKPLDNPVKADRIETDKGE